MPPEHLPPDDPREWLNRAKSSLAQAKARLPQVYLEDLCFDAQQAAEKALKALLVARGCRCPFVHDLGDLIRRLEEAGEVVSERVKEAATLTDYAVEARYPGPGEPVLEEEYTRAVALAEAVVAWVERQIGA